MAVCNRSVTEYNKKLTRFSTMGRPFGMRNQPDTDL